MTILSGDEDAIQARKNKKRALDDSSGAYFKMIKHL